MIFAIVGLVSALLYLRRRQFLDAVLVLLGAVALAALTAQLTLPSQAVPRLALDEQVDRQQADRAAAFELASDGLRSAQWADLPARALQWTPPAQPVLRLEFPRQLTLGRLFVLTVHQSQPGAARLELLAENGEVIAQSAGNGAELSVEWLPPLAESMVLTARLRDGGGKVIEQGPVPLVVREAPPLQVRGRFAAPSFDVQALATVLANSQANVDWQVTLGKTVTRSETPRTPLGAPDLLVVDAAYVERQPAAARAALLAQVGAGMPLVVLGADATDTALWAQALQLPLRSQAEKAVSGALPLTSAALVPSPGAASAWQGAGTLVWTRPWHKGRVTWIAAADWHRAAITAPQVLAAWWQTVVDIAGVRRAQDMVWLDPVEPPLAHHRLELCAQGANGELEVQGQKLSWQPRPDKADAQCAAVWPQKSGWLPMQVRGKQAQAGALYVFADSDWPSWQRAVRREATRRYLARTPGKPAAGTAPLPAWPFALAFAAAMLGLWWRERR